MIASQMVLHLGLGQCSLVRSRHSSSSTSKKRKPMYLSGIELSGLQNSNRNGWAVNGAGKDSEFEVDPDKAREALRKLDEQLQSLSNKQINPPKIRGNFTIASQFDFTRSFFCCYNPGFKLRPRLLIFDSLQLMHFVDRCCGGA